MTLNYQLKKSIVFLIFILFFTEVVLPITAQNEKNILPFETFEGVTLYVGGNGPGNYSRITDAVNEAVDGDIIFVFDDSSPYYENTISIEKSIKLIGENRDTTIIDGKGGGDSIDVIHIYTDDVLVTGFTIRNCSGDYFDTGIYIRGRGDTFKDIPVISNVNISGNIFIDTATGILELKTFHTMISRNYILSGNSSGFLNHTIFGIESVVSSSTIKGNTILNPKAFGMEFFWSHSLVEGNIISNGTQPENQWGISQRSSSNKIIGNTITKFAFGIVLMDFSTFNIISQNNISQTKDGITFSGTSVINFITKNQISQCKQYGVSLSKSIFTVVKENNFIDNNVSAFFRESVGTRWVHNYWDDWGGIGPKVIKGYKWINLDWTPVEKPYNFFKEI